MAQTPAKMVQSPGDVLDYTPVAAVTAGDVIVVGTIPMIAPRDIAAGALGAIDCSNLYDVPKTTATFSAGDAVYWNPTGTPVTGTASSGAADSSAAAGNLMGFASVAALTGDTYVRVKLTAAKRTATIAGSVTADDITGSDSSLGINGIAAAQGGAILATGGTSSTSGNAGGAVGSVGGTPGATGIGGAVINTGGIGGSTSGAGGAVTNTGGAGTAGNSAGGASTVTGGAGQGSAAGGVGKVAGGVGGATGAGGAAQLTGGAGGATSGTGGAAAVAGGAAQGTTAVGGAASLTGGASAGASGTAGAALVDSGAAAGGTGSVVAIGDTNSLTTYIGRGTLKATHFGTTLTALGTVQSSTPTSAQLLGGFLTQTGATGAGTITLPTGTALSAACARTPATGDMFECVFANLGGGQTLTVTGATGTTVISGAAIATAKAATLKFICTGSNAWSIAVVGG